MKYRGSNKPFTTEQFIEKAKLIHGDKYDYSKTEYINCRTKLIITCPEHGEFSQLAGSHSRGCGCPICGVEKSKAVGKKLRLKITKTAEQFIDDAKIIHGDKYDYSKTEYVNFKTKIKIICPEHGEFEQIPNKHLRSCGCPICGVEKAKFKSKTTEQFIDDAKIIHGDKYDYSKSIYKGCKLKLIIICPEHGEFSQTPDNHINGECGCPKCYTEGRVFTTEQFIEKARAVHGDKYDYSKSVYKNTNTKIIIICPEHGEFLQRPNGHIINNYGCPKCHESYGEKAVRLLLEEYNIDYEYEKSFNQLRNPKTGKLLRFDFYLPDYNTCIEFDGAVHYINAKHFGNEEAFINQSYRDQLKDKFCKQNNISLIRIPYYKDIKDIIQNIN